MRRLATPMSALLATVIPSLLLIRDRHPGAGAVVSAIAVSTLGLIALRELEHRDRTVGMAAVWVAGILVITAAVMVVPRNSGDLWAYVFYGRIISVHHANPWALAPAAFPHDPFLHLVSRGWRHTSAIYGPGFVGITTAIAKLAGSSEVAARVLMKSVFGLATVGAGVLVARRTRSAAATALVLLHPVITVSGIAGGHNDILLGLAVLAAALLAMDDHPLSAGVVMALGTTVKFTGAIAILAILAWGWDTHGRAWAARFGATALGGVLLLYLPVGSNGLSAIRQNHGLLSRASPWQLPRLLLGVDPSHRIIDFGIPRTFTSTLITVGTLVTGAVVVWLAIRFRHEATPITGIVAAIGAFVVFAPYSLAWYGAWVIPTLALAPRTPIARMLTIQAATIALVYELKFQSMPSTVSSIIWWSTITLSTMWCVTLIRRSRSRSTARVPTDLDLVTPVPGG